MAVIRKSIAVFFRVHLSESDLSGVGNIVGDPLLDDGFIPGAGSPAIGA